MNRPGLDQVRVTRDDLVEMLRTNRENHRAIFEEAMKGYRKKAINLLEEHIERIRNAAPEKVFVALPMPEDHTADYDQVIAMLEWSLDDELWITEREFSQYVLDEWGWKDAFAASTVGYMGGGNQ